MPVLAKRNARGDGGPYSGTAPAGGDPSAQTPATLHGRSSSGACLESGARRHHGLATTANRSNVAENAVEIDQDHQEREDYQDDQDHVHQAHKDDQDDQDDQELFPDAAHAAERGSSTLPLYSASAAPCVGDVAILRAERVDSDGGVWAQLPEWGLHATAYVAPDATGRGQRDRRDFVAALKKKLDRHVDALFAAEVTWADRRVAVHDDGDRVLLDVTADRRPLCSRPGGGKRRGAPAEARTLETAAMERWAMAHRAAAAVDRAAAASAVAAADARARVCYAAYDAVAGGHAGLKKERVAALCAEALDQWDDARQAETKPRLAEGCAEVAAAAVLRLSGAATLEARARGEDAGSARLAGAEVLHPLGLAKDFATALAVEAEALASALLPPRRACSTVFLRMPHHCSTPSAAAIRAAAVAVRALEPPALCSVASLCHRAAPRYDVIATALPGANPTAVNTFMACAVEAVQASVEGAAHTLEPRRRELGPPTGDEASLSQPELTVGLLGDVANGKSSLCLALTGEHTQRHSAELRHHGATIRLGYAVCAVYTCPCACGVCRDAQGGGGPAGDEVGAERCACTCTTAGQEAPVPACPGCGEPMQRRRLVSFVDCPGHEELMGTALSGRAVLDAAILVVAADTATGLTAQARAHAAALSAADWLPADGVCAVQTKGDLLTASTIAGSVGSAAQPADPVDLVARALAEHADTIRAGLAATRFADVRVMPVAPLVGAGLDPLCRWLAGLRPRHGRNPTEPALMHVVRSFDVNRPGSDAAESCGGAVGGSLARGQLSLGDVVELRPGIATVAAPASGAAPLRVRPIVSVVTSLMAGSTSLGTATAGGLIAVGTDMCPSLCAGNRLHGAVCGAPGTLPPVWRVLAVTHLRPAACGAAASDSDAMPKRLLRAGDAVRVHCGTTVADAVVDKCSGRKATAVLRLAAVLCAAMGSAVLVERACDDQGRRRFALAAEGTVAGGEACEVDPPPEVPAGPGAKPGDEATDPALALALAEEAVHPGARPWAVKADEPAWRRGFAMTMVGRHAEAGARSVPRIPPLRLARQGGAHVIWEDFVATAQALGREPDDLSSFLRSVGGVRGNRAGEVGANFRVRWSGRGLEQRLAELLRAFVRDRVRCFECRGLRTRLDRTIGNGALLGGCVALVCDGCGARRFVDR